MVAKGWKVAAMVLGVCVLVGGVIVWMYKRKVGWFWKLQ